MIFPKSHLSNKNLSCRVYDNALIIPNKDGFVEDGRIEGGVYIQKSRSYEIINESSFAEGIEVVDYTKDIEVEYLAERVIFMGFLHPNCWGHCFTDNIKRIWFFQTKEARDLIDEDVKVVYITVNNAPLAQYAIDLLELLGIDISKCIRIKGPTSCKKVYIPDSSFNCFSRSFAKQEDLWYTKEFCEIIDMLKFSIEKKTKKEHYNYNKIYYTRIFLPQASKEVGEFAICKAFESSGYHIVSPERKSLVEQYKLLQGALEFAALEGSATHNVVFCNKGTKVVVLKKYDGDNNYQILLNEISGVDVVEIPVHHSSVVNKTCPVAGPFFLCITIRLELYLQKFILHLPFWLTPSYYQYAYGNRKIVKKIKQILKLIICILIQHQLYL